MKKFRLFTLAALSASVFLSSCGNPQDETESQEISNGVVGVTVNTSVRKTGQYPESFVITFDNDILPKEISAESFHMSGDAGYWGSSDTRPFEADFKSAVISGKTLTLVPADFPEKYFYVNRFVVECSDDSALGFSSDDIKEIITPVADDFETRSFEGDVSFDYKLFNPEKDGAMPLVIVFHGYGDTSNLLTYRTAVEWAEPENQAVRPCYVLAPSVDDGTYFREDGRDKVFAAIHGIVEEMIADGKVDPDRVYVMGNSFGGLSTIEYAEKYPESVAAAMALCPALNYSANSMMNLKQIADIPIWFAHAEHDNTIPVSTSENAVKSLEKLGAKEVHFTMYSDEEMNAAGADPSPDATYSYHHVELKVMEDDNYMEWMFEKTCIR